MVENVRAEAFTVTTAGATEATTPVVVGVLKKTAPEHMSDLDLASASEATPGLVPASPSVPSGSWMLSISISVAALASLIGGSVFGDVHAIAVRPRAVAWTTALLFMVLGVLATRRVARSLDHSISARTIPAAGAAVRLLASGLGYLLAIFGVFGILDVSISHLLVGAGLAGVVLGIAAQQSLGNVIAAVVLLFSRPFTIGDRVRVRSGALGGNFEATVLGMSLTYVTMRTADGILKVPNSTLLAAGVGVLTPDEEHPAPLTLRAIRKKGSRVRAQSRNGGKAAVVAVRGARRRSSPLRKPKVATHPGSDPAIKEQ